MSTGGKSKLTCLFWVRDVLLALHDCSPVWKSILLYLASFADPDGRSIYHSDRSIAKGLGFDRNTVRRALIYWQTARALVMDKPGKPGRGHGPEWSIPVPQTGEPVTHLRPETGAPFTHSGSTKTGEWRTETGDKRVHHAPTPYTVEEKATGKNKTTLLAHIEERRTDVVEEFGEETYLALLKFEQFRKSIKKPLTQHAWDLIYKRLGELRRQGQDPVKCIEQSIMCGYQGIFAVKETQHGSAKSFHERRSEKSAQAIDKVLGRLAEASGGVQRALPPTRK
jgi:hypothetical protein